MFQFEKNKLIEEYGKKLWLMRTAPSHAAHWLAGVFLPPHERFWLSLVFSNYKENNLIGSRGTSKSFSVASLSFPLYDALHKNSTSLIVSASGFRGGKLLFEDIDRLFKGELRSQRPEAEFLLKTVESSTSGKVVRRQPDMWMVKQKSLGTTMTVPTNKADSMRGIRANNAVVDERNTFEGEIVQKVIRPMLNVGSDFRKTAKGGDRNKIFQVSTIDYTFRDWHVEIITQRQLAEREYEAQRARKDKDWDKYEELMDMDKGSLRQSSFSLSRFDYTDLIIPKTFAGLDGNNYELNYPRPPGIEESDVLVWDARDKVHYYYLYPVDKAQLEGPFLDGTADEDLWLAEQRNVFISASGNVYPHELIVKAADRPIYSGGKVPGIPTYEDDFYPPVLHQCGDPCVVGIDYARESDELGVVVIRLGPLAKGELDPSLTTVDAQGRILVGNTSWSNVIWAESHKKLTAIKAAEVIRSVMERYNIVLDPMVAGGMGMDKFGGGSAVRDELAIPKPPMISGHPDPTWTPPVIIYDPKDDDYKHFAFMEDPKYWGGLELIHPNNQFNLESTMASKAMLQKQHLYIGYYEAPSKWAANYGLLNAMGSVDTSNPLYYQILTGYQGINRLKAQLVRVQSKVSDASMIRFYVPGKKREDAEGNTDIGRKDLYSAFIYACYMARQHLVGMTKDNAVKAPDALPQMVKIGGDYRPGTGQSRGWTSLGWRR